MATRKLPTIEATIESVLKAGRGYPDAQWLADYRGITPSEAYEAIEAHYNGTDWGSLAVKKPPMPSAPDPKIKEKKLPYGNKTNLEHFHDMPKGILKVIFAILSIMAAIRSFGFIYGWFSQWDTGFFSVLMACILTGAMIALPQAAIIFKKTKRYVLLATCCILIFFAITFSMVTTVAGLYNDRSKTLHESSIAGATNAANMDEIAKLEKRGLEVASDKKIDSDEMVTLQAKLANYEPGTLEYNRIVNRVDNLKKRLDGYRNTLSLIQKQIDSKIDSKVYVIERDDFFTYIEGVTGVKRSESEFGISVVVSIIVDIAGPVFATIALFL